VIEEEELQEVVEVPEDVVVLGKFKFPNR